MHLLEYIYQLKIYRSVKNVERRKDSYIVRARTKNEIRGNFQGLRRSPIEFEMENI